MRTRRGEGLFKLIALAFLIRALVPTGYMPDVEAAKAGQFQFVICSGHRPVSHDPAQSRHEGHGHHASHGDQTAHDNSGHGHEHGAHHTAPEDLTSQPAAPGDHTNVADAPCVFAGALASVTLPVAGILLTTLGPASQLPHSTLTQFGLPPYDVGPQLGSRAPPVSVA